MRRRQRLDRIRLHRVRKTRMARNYRKTIVIVTHNQNIAKMADVVVRAKNGKIQSCEEQAAPMGAEEVEW